MIAFGKGLQKNVTKTFNELELFNYLGVYTRSNNHRGARDPDDPHNRVPETKQQTDKPAPVLNDEFLLSLVETEGVEWAFPEMRFPAMIQFRNEEEFTLIQVLPTKICRAGILKLRAGEPYESDDANSLIISDSLLRRLDVKEPETVIGEQIEISTLSFDFSLANIPNILAFLQGRGLPLSRQNYPFTIAGVTERMGLSGPMLMRSDVLIPHGTSERMKKIQLTSVSDLFASTQQSQGYSSIGIRLSSPKYVDSVKKQMEDLGLETFSFMDQLQEIKTGFIFVDMFLFAVGMIAITVASLGIINTLVMSILERYKEIGIMKAVGASDRDVKKIFFFEAGVIGFMGGVFGLALGWIVSLLINLIINGFAGREGVPYINYFSFPWWLSLGAIVFSILVSLIAGIYPTIRAARVDPVVALRHD
jgi:putative ABC transport system permease protein